ncbi:MAG: ABC transporter ATP-binding protein [Eubacteriales bacterium]
MKALSFKNIDKIYSGNVQAVFDFNLEVEEGEFIVFVGPSGCGKSTILRMIAGLEEISGGTLSVGDKVINKVAPQDRDIAFVFQNYALYGNLTVYDNIGMSMKVRHEDQVDIHDVVIPTAEMLGLSDYLNRYPDMLSGGQKQRVALGRAITRHPKVFLMDEPLSNLDAKLRASTRVEILEMQRKLGVTTVYVTHDQVEAMAMADRIVLLKLGRVQQIDTPANVYNDPANMFVASFIGTPQINFINGKIEKDVFVAGSMRLPLTAAQEKALAGRSDVVLGMRPENIYVCTDDMTPTVELPVTNYVYFGDSTTLTIDLDGQDIQAKVRVNDDVNAYLGTKKLFLNSEKALYFDPVTEEAIRVGGT